MCLSRPKHTSSKHLGASDLSILIRIEQEKIIGAVWKQQIMKKIMIYK